MDLQALQANYKPTSIAPSAPTASQTTGGPKFSSGIGGFLERNLPTIGAIGGGIGGEALNVFGGGVAGAAAGSALGQKLQNKLTGGKGSTTKAAVAGGVGQGIGGAIAKVGGGIVSKLVKSPILSAADHVAQGADTKTALEHIAPFRGVNPKVLADNNLGSSMENLKNFGMKPTPQNMRMAADAVTGENGAASGTMRQILASTPHVNVADVSKSVEKAIGKEGGQLGQLSTKGASPANNLAASIRNEFQSTLFGNEGSLSGRAEANAVFDTIQNLEGRIRSLGNEGVDGAEKRVLQSTKQSLEDKLYNHTGINDIVKNYKLAPEDIGAIHNTVNTNGGTDALANHIVNGINDAKTGKDLRALQRPFVQMSNLANEADKVAGGKGTIRAIDEAARGRGGGGGLGGGNTTRDIYYSMQNPAMLPFLVGDAAKSGVIGGAMAKGAPAVEKATQLNNSLPGPESAGGVVSKVLGQKIAQPGLNSASPPTDNSQAATPSATPDLSALSTASGAATPASASTGGDVAISKEQLIGLVSADPKNASTYIALYNATKPPATTGSKPTAQNLANAQSGLASVKAVRDMIKTTPDVIRNSATPGQSLPLVGGYITNATGAGSYEEAANNALDALARIRTGAAMTKSEQVFYKNMLPKAGDSPQTIESKLSQLESVFSAVSGNGA